MARRRSRFRRFVGSMLLVAPSVVSILAASPAYAAVTCTYTPNVMTGGGSVAITMTAAADSAILKRSGVNIQVNGADCGTLAGIPVATVTNTDGISASGAAGTQTLTLDQTGGLFAPGAEDPEGPGSTAEIEMTFDLAAGTDTFTIIGTTGADVIDVGLSGINLNDDNDVDISPLNIENITVSGDAGADVLNGAGGTIAGAAYDQPLTLNGGNDSDTLKGGTAGDIVNGDAGSDTITGGSGSDTLNGGVDADSLTGDADGDALNGGDGNDSLVGSGAADTLDGGNDIDTADYSASSLAVIVGIAGTGVGGDAAGDTLPNIENITGSLNDDILQGDAGMNVLSGGLGNDILRGSAGADTIAGGGGSDTASFEGTVANSEPGGVTVDLSTDPITATGGHAQGDILSDIENLFGTNFPDVLTGDNGPNVLTGQSGNDTLTGLDGNDTLKGVNHNDALFGGLGDDSLDGGPGTDSCDGGGGTNNFNRCESQL